MIECGFFNSIDGDRKYNAEQMSNPYKRIVSDGVFAESFMDNFGKTDLNGVVAHIALYEQKAMRRLEDAEKDTAAKCRLYTVLGLFAGTAAALLLI